MRTQFQNFTPFHESGGLKPSVKEAGGGRVYRGVTLIRAGLGNRRDMNFYPEQSLKESADSGMFEGLKAYADHPTAVDEQIQPERTVRDFVGLYTNTKFKESRGGRPGRIVGDLRILKAHRWLSDVVDELIEIGQADKIGISINGNGKTERKTVREAGEELEANVVSKFMALRSADVVTEAGAGGGFQQILESARSKETPMNRKAIMKALREAADAGETDKVKDLTVKLEECDCAAAAAKAKAKKVQEAKRRRGAADPDPEDAAVDEDDDPDADDPDADDDPADPDRELDEATDDVKDSVDDDDDDDPDADDPDTDDLDESGDPDADDPADDAPDPADRSRRAVNRLRQHAQQSKTREAKDLNGVPGKGNGSFTKKAARPRGQGGRRYAEANDPDRSISGVNRLELRDENVRLKRQLTKVSQRNERLAESLGAHRRADLARKLLKDSEIAPELRPTLVERLVRGCPGGDMREAQRYMEKEIAFHQRLVESVAGRAADHIEDDFDDVEGAGSRFRESYGGGDGGESNDFVDLFRESGLPMRQKAK